MTKYKDEIEVMVLSALGQQCGVFQWPKECWKMLEKLNKSTQGYYFRKVGKEYGLTPFTDVIKKVQGK